MDTQNPTQQVMVQMLSEHDRTGKRWPVGMPKDVHRGAEWFLGLIEPPDPRVEKPRKVPLPGKEGVQAWHFPYRDRAMLCLKKFLCLSEDFQRTIIAAKDDGCRWRGEDHQTFLAILDETIRMQDMGPEQYREKYKPMLKAMGVTPKDEG